MRGRSAVSAAVTATINTVGTAGAVVVTFALAVAWLVVGLAAGFGGHWFDLLHAFTGVTTFLMVFLLRHAEGREARATLVKLDELLAVIDGTRADVISIEKEDLHTQERIEERPGPGAGTS